MIMVKILARIFINDYTNTKDAEVRNQYGVLSGVVGIISNTILSIAKILLGFFFQSISILADGINNLSDVSTSVVTLLGFRLAKRPADEEHPYGHERIEYIAGLIVSIVILFIGLTLLQTSIQKIIDPQSIIYSRILLWALGISIVIKIWQSIFYRNIGKIIDSKTLFASSFDSFSDVLATTVVLIGIIVLEVWEVNLDGYIGAVVSLVIIFNGIKFIKETVSPLVGEAPSKEFIQEVKDHIKSYQGVLGLHDLIVHNYGPNKRFISVHVEVDAKVNVMESHALIDRIEYDFNQQENLHMIIHMDPIDLECPETLELKQYTSKMLHEIDENLRFHDFRRGLHNKNHHIMFDVVVSATYPKSEDDLIALIKKNFKKDYPAYKVFVTIDKNYFL